MKNYLLDNYHLSFGQLMQSAFVSEIGLRHCMQAKLQPEYRWGHLIIAAIEFCPLIGQLATIIELIVAKCINPFFPNFVLNRVCLFSGSQRECEGFVSPYEVEQIRARLEHLRPQGIRFNRNSVSNYVQGGTCTAMSLHMIDRYFAIKNVCMTMSNFRSEILNRIIEIGPQLATSSTLMRTQQAAYNTIEVDSRNANADHSRNKVQSLIADRGLLVNYASSEIDVSTLQSETQLAPAVDTLPEGTYLVRIVQPANNERLEVQGHTLVYVKERGVNIHYDPNYGAQNIVGVKHSQVLFQSFKSCFSQFQISKARFYRIQTAAC